MGFGVSLIPLPDHERPKPAKQFFREFAGRFGLLLVSGAETMNPTPTPSEDLLALIARRTRIIAEPTRIRLLLELEYRQATVQELSDDLLFAAGAASCAAASRWWSVQLPRWVR